MANIGKEKELEFKGNLAIGMELDGIGKIEQLEGIDTIGGAWEKADVVINGTGYSIKCKDGGKPSIFTGIGRKGFDKWMARTGKTYQIIDKAYHRIAGENRKTMKLVEVIENNQELEEAVELIKYFTFEGTATQDTLREAQAVITITGNSYKVETKEEYIMENLDNFIVELRTGKEDENWNLTKDGKTYSTISLRIK